MNSIVALLLIGCLAYLMGSIPFGKLVGHRRDVDIQKHGSGNIGFANVLRVLGWRDATVVLIFDVLKGFVPTLIATHLLSYPAIYVVALAAIAGHIHPVWLRFRGGKGVATGLGTVMAISPITAFFGLGFYITSVSLLRKSAPSSVIATWSLPLIAATLDPSHWAFCLILAFIATWTHRRDIKNYLKQPAHVK